MLKNIKKVLLSLLDKYKVYFKQKCCTKEFEYHWKQI